MEKCGGLSNAPPPNIQILVPGTCEWYLLWQKRLYRCDHIEDLDARRVSWTTQVGPQHNHTCLYQREAEGNLTTEEGKQCLALVSIRNCPSCDHPSYCHCFPFLPLPRLPLLCPSSSSSPHHDKSICGSYFL